MAADKRLARARISIARGGFDAALVSLQYETPDLLIIDSTLRTANLLASVERLKHALAQGAKVIIIGAVNDVGLFRELAQRGVSEYILAPVAPEALTAAICRLYAQADKSRVIAVVGARGGIGASTVAHNLAWSIAERQGVGATLIDLDLPFGGAALSFRLQTTRSLGDALAVGEAVEPFALEEIASRRSDRLTVLTAPASVRGDLEMNLEALEKVIAGARRMSAFVVLDLPHLWTRWVKQALIEADEVVLVAAPDLASLRNTDNMLKFLREARRDSEPVVVLSMVGVPKRPEIPLKEFAEALDLTPAVSLAFDPSLYGEAAMAGCMLGEVAARAKAAQALDELATALTGHAPDGIERTSMRAEPLLELAQVLVEPAPERSLEEHVDIAANAQPASNDNLDPFDPNEPHEEADVRPAAPNVPPGAFSPREAAPIVLLPMPQLDDYIERARKSAHVEAFLSEDEEAPPPARASFGFARLFAAGATLLVVMVASGAWYVQSRLHSVAAVEPAAADAAIPAPVVAPLPPIDPVVNYAEAVRLLDTEPARGAALMQQAADAGFPLAQYRLAQLYEHGEGVAADIRLARQWTERAALAGNVRAMHDLGVYNAMGDAAPVDDASAFRWFQQAAEFGLADSQYNLGILYAQGRGVEANAGEAMFWFLLAARQGDEAAIERVAALETELDALDLEQAEQRAQSFQPRLADPRANEEPAPPADPAAVETSP